MSETNQQTKEESWFVNRQVSYDDFKRLCLPKSLFNIMLIEARADFGKTWLLRRMELQHCRQQGIAVARVNFHNEFDKRHISDFLGLIQLLRQRLGLPREVDQEGFSRLDNELSKHTPDMQTESGRLTVQFARELAHRSHRNEIKQIVVFMGWDIGNIDRGEKIEHTLNLVKIALQREALEKLLEAIEETFDQGPLASMENWRAQFAAAVDQPAASTTSTFHLPLADDNEYESTQRLISQAFFDGLSEISQERDLVFLIDAYDDAPAEIEKWFENLLFPWLNVHYPAMRNAPSPSGRLVFVFAGRQAPRPDKFGEARPFILEPPVDPADPNRRNIEDPIYRLLPFSDQHIEEYLKLRSIPIPDESEWAFWRKLHRGIPGKMALQAEGLLISHMESGVDVPNSKTDSFFTTPV